MRVKITRITKKSHQKLLVLLVIIQFVIIGALLLRAFPQIGRVFALATSAKAENFTELYFENYRDLPYLVEPNQNYTFKFILHNLENTEMEYPYEVYLENNGNKLLLDKQSVVVENNGYKTIQQNISLSGVSQALNKIVVNLVAENQQISFWTHVIL